MKYVDPEGGKFTIAKAIQAQFNEAIKYLSTSSEAKAVLDVLESSPVEFKIQHSNEARKYGKAWAASCGSACYGDTNEVFWDPEMGLSVPGGVMSPALLLAHEFGHAIQHLTNPKKYKSDISGAPRNSLNFNAEEERNLRFETKVANQLKEVTRKFYRGAIGFIKASTAPTAKSSSPWGD